MDVSTKCLEEDVVEDDGELAAFELLNPNLLDFAPCFDAIAFFSQALNTTKRWVRTSRDLKFSIKR